MAGIQWTGGAHAGARAAKANLRHNDRDERFPAEHANEEINKTLTPGNWSVVGGSYAEKCRRYDERIAQVADGVRMSSGKNANNTLQVCIVYEPQALDGTRLDREQLYVFYGNVYEIACEMFGRDNVVELDVHVDELHNYIDPAKGEVESRIHGHLAMVPAVPFAVKTERVRVLDADGNPVQLTDKDGAPQYYAKDDPLGNDEDGYRWRAGDPKVKTRKVVTREQLPDGEYRLNWNEFASKANIIEFNQRVHEMCQREFGMDYMIGEGKHAGKTVEELKRESRIAKAEGAVAEMEARVDHVSSKFAELMSEEPTMVVNEVTGDESPSLGMIWQMRHQAFDALEDTLAAQDEAIADVVAARQEADEATFEAKVMAHEAKVAHDDAQKVKAEAKKTRADIEAAKTKLEQQQATLAEGQAALERDRQQLADDRSEYERGYRDMLRHLEDVQAREQAVQQREQSLDADEKRLKNVENDDFFNFVTKATSSEEGMRAMFSLKTEDGRSVEDDVNEQERDYTLRQRLMRRMMNMFGRLMAAMQRKWAQDHDKALENAIQEREAASNERLQRAIDEANEQGHGAHDGSDYDFGAW